MCKSDVFKSTELCPRTLRIIISGHLILISENLWRVGEVPEYRKKVNMMDIFTEEKSED